MDDSNDNSRREFLRFSFLMGKKQVQKQVRKRVPRIGIRPPGAISEPAFLLSCTRCNDCVEACPHDAIFKPEILDAKIYGETPFMDFNSKACEMCEDYPCITACSVDALRLEERFLKIGIAQLNEEHCLVKQGQRCDYCINECPKEYGAISVGEDNMPVIDEDLCVGCGKCEYICVSQTGKALEVKWIVPKEEDPLDAFEQKDKSKEEDSEE